MTQTHIKLLKQIETQITEWVNTSVHMLSLAGESSTLTTLYKLKRIESTLKNDAEKLKESSGKVPLFYKERFYCWRKELTMNY